MKTNYKRWLQLIIITCMGITLGACSNESSDKKAEADRNTSGLKKFFEESSLSEDKLVEKSSVKIEFSKDSGLYEEEFGLELKCSSGAIIYYTTDGSNPITSSTRMQYESPIMVTDRSNDKNYVSAVNQFLFDSANVRVNGTRDGFTYNLPNSPADEAVDKCTVIRAAALDGQGLYSEVVTNTYFIGNMKDHIIGIEESCKAAGTSLAVISLTMDYGDLFDEKTGIYVKGEIFDKALKNYLAAGNKLTDHTSRELDANYKQRGRQWERNAHIDFFESDGTETFCRLQQNCGIRIQGNYSRSDLQKSFRLYARNDYGEKNFVYPFFGEDLKDDYGNTIMRFKTLVLRNGGNCAFTSKFNDTYWQSLVKDLACDTQTSRPCVLYINGEYWGLYVLQEDYQAEYFEYKHWVNKDDVVLYKGDAETYAIGYKLDLGELPEGTQDVSYYFKDLLDFFETHKDLTDPADYEEFSKLVDVESARDYFAVQIWINNKWDWPGKNWSMWRTIKKNEANPYADCRWRFVFYDVEFGGVSGKNDAYINTIKENNYKLYGMLDRDTDNPAVLVFVYLMTNERFREEFKSTLLSLNDNHFNYSRASKALNTFKDVYEPLFDQFFERYPGSGSRNNSINGGYASYKCISDFLMLRANYIQPMLDYVDDYFENR